MRTNPQTAPVKRSYGPYASATHRTRYRIVVTGLAVGAITITTLLLMWGNPFDMLTHKWWKISQMRLTMVSVILIVTFCQGFATVAFQTVTNNRIITPSIMGFEALYVLIHTSIVFFFGATQSFQMSPLTRFILQSALMVVFAVLLYSWLLSGRFGNLHVMLLVGIILGAGMGSLAVFMQQMLDPNEFDVLQARLFGSIGNADTNFMWVVIPVVAITGCALWGFAYRLDVIALGQDTAINLGLNHKKQLMIMLTLISVLMAMTTSLVGPMTFLGFLSATLAYSVINTFSHRRTLIVAWLIGYIALTTAYFLLRHVFPLAGAVTVVVELVGGVVFLIVILRKGRL